MSDGEIWLHIKAVVVLLFAMVAIGLLGEVSRQNWNAKVTAYPTKTEEAIENYARQLLAEMTLEEKVGQMFYAADGVDAETAAEYGLGGVLLQTSRLENLSKSDVTAVLHGYEAESEIPVFVGVSEEGGAFNTVSVIPALRTRAFLSPRELMTTGGMKLVDSDAREKSDLLRELGVSMNFAPVCDVVTEDTAMMYPRTISGDADDAARYVETVVTAMNDRRVIGVLKYFPGYGNLPSKEHTEILTDNRTIEELEANLLPYIRGVEAGAPAVMMGNSIVTAVDSERPASLSRDVHNLLRRQTGFDGVIISGDLQALGMGRYGDQSSLAVQAVQAGSDMLLTVQYAEQIDAVVQAVRSGSISEERIDESVLRILQLKIAFGLVQ